ncbi:uncharacterized protein LOC144636369 isoform X3 [Oculina patagonica]
MRLLFAACFTANLLALIAVRGAKSSPLVKDNQTPSKIYADNMMVCNLIQDSHVNEAIKTQEMKLEKIIAMVNKTLTPQPKPPAALASSCRDQNDKHNDSHVSEAIKALEMKLEKMTELVNKTLTSQPKPPAPSSSCKEKNDKYNDSHVSEAIKMLEIKLDKLTELVNQTLTSQPKPPAAPVSSCKEQYEKDKSSKSQVFTLMFGSQKIPVYCHMGNFGCGDGGWTLAMKIDGTKRTFHYDSHFWRDRNAYNLAGGKTGFDFQETKLPTYWNTPFSKICLGMRIGHQKKFIVINRHANSLYSLIADGQYRATSLGRYTWKSLIGSRASLQTNCNKEGFNAASGRNDVGKARIGFLGNNENDCGTCDSRIGFGTGGLHDDSNTCGNEAIDHPSSDNGGKHIKAMGYILVQ